MTKESSTRLQILNDLMTQDKIKLVNLHQFNFADFQKAHRVVYAGHQTGNTILWISKDIPTTQ
jgi:hypothetical protein